jgi:hypothetical protein
MPLFNASWIKIAFGDELSIVRDVFKTFVNRHFGLQGSWASTHSLRSRLSGVDLNEPFAAEQFFRPNVRAHPDSDLVASHREPMVAMLRVASQLRIDCSSKKPVT